MIKKDKSGFTIIEVVLVLAIAGLIFLMVFIALPALQRSQRDTQRRDDMARVATALTQYQSNNGGNLPGYGATVPNNGYYACKPSDVSQYSNTAYNAKDIAPNNYTGTNIPCKFIAQYMNASSSATNEFKDPDGTFYGIILFIKDDSTALNNRAKSLFGGSYIHIFLRAECNGETAEYTGNDREYAIMYKLEGAGTYCTDNK